MKKRRTPKAVKALTLFSSLELSAVLLWEHSLAADSINTPFNDSSVILSWGTLLSVSLSLLFWNYLKKNSKGWRRCHVFSGTAKEIVPASNLNLTDSQRISVQ